MLVVLLSTVIIFPFVKTKSAGCSWLEQLIEIITKGIRNTKEIKFVFFIALQIIFNF